MANIIGAGLGSYLRGCAFNSTSTVSQAQEDRALASYHRPIGASYNAFAGVGSSYSPMNAPSSSISVPPRNDVNRMSEYAMSITSRPTERGSDGRYK